MESIRPYLHRTKVARKLLGDISNSTLYRLFHAKELHLVKQGRYSYISDEEIQDYVRRKIAKSGASDARAAE